MNIVKRILGDNRGGTQLAVRRNGHTSDLLSWPSHIDSIFEQLWREFDQGPWGFLNRMPEVGPMQFPAVDVVEDDKTLTMTFDMPGLKPDNVEIEVTGHVLTVRGSRTQEQEQQDRRTLVRERISGTFQRSIGLPDYIDPDKVEARFAEGVLTVTAPKDPAKLPRKIQIAS